MKVKDLIRLLNQVDPELEISARSYGKGSFSQNAVVRYSKKLGRLVIDTEWENTIQDVVKDLPDDLKRQ